MCRNQQGTKNLFKYMSEITWTRRHDQITMYDDMKDDTKNNVVVCSENMSVKQAIYDYMSLYSFYVEQLHYNNNGQLDAFIDHRGNMFVENNEYDIRKQICESLYKKYNIHDFKWANQSDYMSLYSFYVEQLHYNNNGQLDAFIDHRGNMFVENNEYDIRKQICESLYKKYNIHDFKWANQSYTSLANSLFKTMVGYLPESNYNNGTRDILDRYYPKAIQW